ncbi:hypothetical protein [Streptomyces sp. NPDC096030]|uniref:hypothetical protein n=1 Tax=Streptomyces sp. NPDC096030 TaxID=3155423 RepID=UPI0033232EF3
MSFRSKFIMVLAGVAGTVAVAVPASAQEVSAQAAQGTVSYTTPYYGTASFDTVAGYYQGNTTHSFECWSNPTQTQAFLKVSGKNAYVPRDAVTISPDTIPECR